MPAGPVSQHSPQGTWNRFARRDRLSQRRHGEPGRSSLASRGPPPGYLGVVTLTPTVLGTLIGMNHWSVYMGLNAARRRVSAR
jgi:hypothetical protein